MFYNLLCNSYKDCSLSKKYNATGYSVSLETAQHPALDFHKVTKFFPLAGGPGFLMSYIVPCNNYEDYSLSRKYNIITKTQLGVHPTCSNSKTHPGVVPVPVTRSSISPFAARLRGLPSSAYRFSKKTTPYHRCRSDFLVWAGRRRNNQVLTSFESSTGVFSVGTASRQYSNSITAFSARKHQLTPFVTPLNNVHMIEQPIDHFCGGILHDVMHDCPPEPPLRDPSPAISNVESNIFSSSNCM
ncbi:hypothetical protein EDC04DRAFT_3097945 [Pisolithus marmoratus]|nr:hypothetical protein EDC04DRAFT_3097945 [Pisolithus marmoratus]